MKLIPKTTRPGPFQGLIYLRPRFLFSRSTVVCGKKKYCHGNSFCTVTKLFGGGGWGEHSYGCNILWINYKEGFFILLTTVILQGNILSECVIYNVILLLLGLVSYSYCLYICIFLYMVSFHWNAYLQSLWGQIMMYIELQCAVILWSEPAQSNLYFNMSQATTNIYNL